MVIEGKVLLWIQHLEQRRRGIPSKISRHLIDLIHQKDRIAGAGLLHDLDDLPRERADIGATMAPNLRLIPDSPQGDPDKLPSRRPGDGTAQGSLANARSEERRVGKEC